MDEPQTGAIRMIAFGVLEYKDPAATIAFSVGGSLSRQQAWNELKRRTDEEQKNLELEAMILAEFNGLGWKLAHKARPFAKEFILLGALSGTTAFKVRPKIGEGSLRDVCLAAVRWLDEGPPRKVTSFNDRD